MYKIKFVPTGHIFLLPDIVANELKIKYPDEYLLLEKNGKKCRDLIKKKIETPQKSILDKVIDK